MAAVASTGTLVRSLITVAFLPFGPNESFFFSSTRRHTRCGRDWSSGVCSSDRTEYEIYNFVELRKKLIEAGHRFRTQSDTEIILHAWEEYGEECVNQLRGMFAFAIWDDKEKRLFAARDRIGIKPFYYYFDRERFAFASEIKSLLEIPEISREIDFRALPEYLRHG